MPIPFHAVLEWLAVLVIVVAVADIAAPPHVATRALDESAAWVSIAVVSAAEVGGSGDLDDTPAAIAYLDGCGGSSQAEADVQERNERDRERSGCGGLWRIDTSAARHSVRVELTFLRLFLKIQNSFLHLSSIVFWSTISRICKFFYCTHPESISLICSLLFFLPKNVCIDRAIGAPGHGKDLVGGLNACDKQL